MCRRLKRLHKRNLHVMKEARIQADEVAAEITKKLEKRRNS